METEAQAGQPRSCGLIPSRAVMFFSSLKHPDWLLGPPNSLFQGYWGGCFFGVEWLVREDDRSPLYSAIMAWTESLLLFVFFLIPYLFVFLADHSH